MSLSTQTQEKDAQIEKLRAEVMEKDTELAYKIKDFEHGSSQLRQSLEEEQHDVDALISAEWADLPTGCVIVSNTCSVAWRVALGQFLLQSECTCLHAQTKCVA